MVQNLLPLLRRSTRSRVLSVLNGTLEKPINENDLGLERIWGIAAVVNHTTVCTSLAFDMLAANDKENNIVFLHATPGLVSTNTPRKMRPSKESGLLWWAFMSTVQVVSGWVIYYFGMPVAESGERQAYHLTSEDFKPGSWQVNRHSVVLPPNKALKEYQERGLAGTIWDHTLRVWERAVSTSRGSA